jgi:hypothetical protein
MTLNSPVDLQLVKRGSQLLLSDYTLSMDHFRIRVYALALNGTRTLIFTSNQFTSLTGVAFTLKSANNAGSNEIAALDETAYQLELVEYDAAETTESILDEFFYYVLPDELQTSGSSTSGLNTVLFDKLLYMLGENSSLLNFNNSAGYTASVKRRGYATTLTLSEAQAILAAYASPDDSDVSFKTDITVTTTDSGDESQTTETEASLTP